MVITVVAALATEQRMMQELHVLPWPNITHASGQRITPTPSEFGIRPARLEADLLPDWRLVPTVPAKANSSPVVFLALSSGRLSIMSVALLRSLLVHNLHRSFRLILAADTMAIYHTADLIDKLHRDLEARGIQPALTVQVIPLQPLALAAHIKLFAAELLPHHDALIVLEPDALVLGTLEPLWELLALGTTRDHHYITAPYATVASGRHGVVLLHLARLRSLIMRQPELHPAFITRPVLSRLGFCSVGGSDGGSDGGGDGGSNSGSNSGGDGGSDEGSDGGSDGASNRRSDGGGDGASNSGSDAGGDGGSNGGSDGGGDVNRRSGDSIGSNGGSEEGADALASVGSELLRPLFEHGAGVWQVLPCEWGYSALADAHSPASSPAGVLFVVCRTQLAHQAFARAWAARRDLLHGSEARIRCTCGSRIRISVDHLPDHARFYASAPLAELLAVARHAIHAPLRVHALPMGESLAMVAAEPLLLPPPRDPPVCAGGVVPLIFACDGASVELHWLSRVLMARCGGVRERCLSELVAAHHGEDQPTLDSGLLCAGAVFVIQDQQYGAVLDLLAVRGLSPSHFAMVHISHSYIYQDEAPLAASRYRAWRTVFRNNWSVAPRPPTYSHPAIIHPSCSPHTPLTHPSPSPRPPLAQPNASHRRLHIAHVVVPPTPIYRSQVCGRPIGLGGTLSRGCEACGFRRVVPPGALFAVRASRPPHRKGRGRRASRVREGSLDEFPGLSWEER